LVVKVADRDYCCHSQLSFRFGEEQVPGYDNAKGNKNELAPTFDPTGRNPALDAYPPAQRVEVRLEDSDSLFAAGSGELHLYLPE